MSLHLNELHGNRPVLHWYTHCLVPENNSQSLNELPQRMAPVTKELMHYWIEHPDAQGTEEVIAEWWLLEHQIRQVIAQVRENLKELVGRNFVIAVQQGDGRVRYQLNRKKDVEIRKWLESGEARRTRRGPRAQ